MREFHTLLLSNYIQNKKNSKGNGLSEANNSLTGLQKSPSGYHGEAETLGSANGGITVL
jgi:hypothetical protein